MLISQGVHLQWGVKQVQGRGKCQNHSPGGAMAAAFFVGVIFRVSIRENKYNYTVIQCEAD